MFQKNAEMQPKPEELDLDNESAFMPELDWRIQAQQIANAPNRASVQYAPGQLLSRPPAYTPVIANQNSMLASIQKADENGYYTSV